MSEGNKDFTKGGGVIDLTQNRRGRVKNDNSRKLSAEEKKVAYENSLKRLIKAVEKDGGRYIEFVDKDGGLNRGIMVAGVKDGNRLCFAYYDKNKTVRQAFHGDTYRLLREIPIEFSIIDYLYRHEFNDFKTTIEEKLNATGWELLTDVTLRKPFFERKDGDRHRNGKKKFRKNNDQKKNGTSK
jgi:hypothetical protein